jgi:hypothetical protein
VDTKPLRVEADREVALTAAERKKLFDMAMELHDLQRRAAQMSTALQPFNTRMAELSKEIDGRPDVPPDVKASFQALNKDLAAVAPKFSSAGGGRGGAGGPGGSTGPSLLGRISQAKNGVMGGFWPTAQTLETYAEVKTATPKAIAEANALFARAGTLSATLATHRLTLSAPQPVAADPAPTGKKK